jgi:aldehyde:ferredoxin oxidoreductase
MGAKRLKAIVTDDSGCESRPLAHPERYRPALRRYHEALQAHPVTGKSLPTYGTNALVATIDTLGGLPTRNFSQGSFALGSQIGGDALHDLIVERGAKTTHPCMPGCIIRCSNTFFDSEGQELTRGFEYESIVMLGANCGIGNLDALARLNRRCDELGLDTIEMGVAIGVAMEAGLLAFGDTQAALTLLDQVGQGTALGRILGQGAAVTGRVFNVRRVPVVKGQAISAYDPRAIKGTAVTYATSPQGADHTAGNCLPGSRLPDGTKPDVHRREYQVALSRYMQELSMAFDSLGLCWFARQPILKNPLLLTDLLTAVLGGEWTMNGLLAAGRAALQVELDFNREAGFTPADDRLPDFYAEEPLSPLHLTFDLSPEELQGAVADP